jgi:nitrite reductase (NO-forming)
MVSRVPLELRLYDLGNLIGSAELAPGVVPLLDQAPAPHAGFFAYLIAVIETLIAAALIFGFARKATYFSAAVFSLLIWTTAEGFGGPYTSGATDIGTSIIYVLMFAGLATLAYYAGVARYSADHYIEKRVSWWWRVAEMRRPTSVIEAVGVPSLAALDAQRLSA